MSSPPPKSPAAPQSPPTKSASQSPTATGQAASPRAAGSDDVLQSASHWVDRPVPAVAREDDIDSSWGGDKVSSTASISSSILNYRKINGRTYHSEQGNANYWGSNDEQASETMDMNHHLMMLCYKSKLFKSPITQDIEKILDIGTGTGIWAIDMGDDFPSAEVIGTDVSPMQPTWVPPNVKFEIEDFTRDWTFEDNTFDLVHMRYLVGSVANWKHLMEQAYRVCKPGGWVESGEGLAHPSLTDDTVKPGMAVYDWAPFWANWGRRIGHPVEEVILEDMQQKYMLEAGFEDVHVEEFLIPIGNWPKDPELAHIGRFAYATFSQDFEGYIGLPAREMLGWGPTEVAIFCAHLRAEAQSRDVHWAYKWRTVWARKPLNK